MADPEFESSDEPTPAKKTVARVPNIESAESILGPSVDVKPAATVADQRAVLAEIDRQLAVIESKKLDRNGNYENVSPRPVAKGSRLRNAQGRCI